MIEFSKNIALAIRDSQHPAWAGKVVALTSTEATICSRGKCFQLSVAKDFCKAGDYLYFDGNNLHLLSEGNIQNFNLATLDTTKLWSLFVKKIRDIMAARGISEVRSPSLVQSPGVETYIDPYQVTEKTGMYLPTSPEIHHKKLLASGLEDIYEIKECFRKEEVSPLHKDNFIMLEWYRAYANLDLILEDLIAILEVVFEKKIEYQTCTIQDLFQRFCDFKIEPKTNKEDLCRLAHSLGVILSDDDTWNDVFHRIYLEKIEPHFRDIPFLVITNYPPHLAALARIDGSGWAQRFELYINGVEVANAYDELRGKSAYQARFNEVNQMRKLNGKDEIKVDSKFLDFMSDGIPASAGIAMGLDRLFMLGNKFDSVQEAMPDLL